MADNEDECATCTRWQRIGRYLLLRLKEPSTWAGITVAATAFGVNLSPDKAAAIGSVGALVASILLAGAREGRAKPDNPTLGATLSGQMPPPKPAIVPPASTESLPVVPAGAARAEPSGEVVADKKP